MARFQLARALWETGDRGRAATLAVFAQSALPEGRKQERAEVARWIARHPAPLARR
jgi:hypothetical protein